MLLAFLSILHGSRLSAPEVPLIANPFSFFLSRPFIKSLFPENLQADKKGRPTTAGSKIKVCSIWGGRVL